MKKINKFVVNMDQIKLSIIVKALNEEGNIASCLDSIYPHQMLREL